jgi:hypothetical protein
MSFENEFDLSNVTLKELQDIRCVISEEYRQIRETISARSRNLGLNNGQVRERGLGETQEEKDKLRSMNTYVEFLNKAIQIKIIDEMNKTYFGSKITLKNKLPQAEVVEESLLAGIRVAGVGKYFGKEEHVEYEPLFPVMPP